MHLTEAMRVMICVILALTGCSSEQTKTFARAPGWTTSLDKYRNGVFFRFADASDTTFSGICDSRPVFGLYGGDYPLFAEWFTFTVDQRTWELRTFHGQHGRSLPVDDPQFVELLRSAKQRISFRARIGFARSGQVRFCEPSSMNVVR